MSKKKIAAWALYDLANTAFTSPFVTIFWPLLIIKLLGGNEFQIGATIAVGTIFFSAIVPVLGVLSDNSNVRKPFIVIPTLVMITIIAFLPSANLFWNLLLAGIATVMYNLSLTIYNALLPTLASEEEMGNISGLGMATGFTGTLLSLLVAYLTLWYFAAGNLNVIAALKSMASPSAALETEKGIRAVFPVIGIFFLAFSLPLFFVIKDENKKKIDLSSKNIRRISSRVISNIKGLFKIKGMLSYILYFSLFSNALAAIDIFFFLFAYKEIGMSLSGFMLLFMFQSFGACLGAIIFGKAADTYGAKKMLQICTIAWILVIAAFITWKSPMIFMAAGLIGSVAFGGSLANSRTLFVFLSPKKNMGEYFGYSQIMSRFAALIGPLLGGWLILKYGYNYALIMVIIFLLLCMAYLNKTPDLRAADKKTRSIGH